MAGEFSEAGILNPTVRADDIDLIVSWSVDDTVPANYYFQVYVDRVLIWSGPERVAVLPGLNVAAVPVLVHVGAVAEANRLVDYGATLQGMPGGGNRALLTWSGGGWEPSVAQYVILGSTVPDGPLDSVTPRDRVRSEGAAGFGAGSFGVGPFGFGSHTYQWTSNVLAPGRWLFAVVPATAGDIRAEDYAAVAVDISGPPAGPKPVNGKKVWISSFAEDTGRFTVSWKY